MRTVRKPREKTIEIRGSARDRNGQSFAWGRGGSMLFYSPPKATDWGGGFCIQFHFENPTLGFFVSPGEARKLAAELLRRAEDMECRS